MSEALVFGGVNLDQVVYLPRPPKEGETLEGESIQTFLGGKGANQAVALSRLGASVAFVGNVGEDSFGNELSSMLSEENIDLSMLGLVKENTGTALINVFESSDNQIVYIPGANKSTSHKQVTTEFLEKALVVVSQMEVNSEEVDQLFRKSKSSKCINILNVAPYRKPSKTLVENTDFLVFNELEFSLFSGLESSMPLDIDTINGALKDQNFINETAVIVTLGERGLVYLQNNHFECIEAHKVKAIDSVGSGDCFVGALSFSLLKGLNLKESCEFANKAASISVTRKGAAASMPRTEEVENLT
tara:strand:- start:335 stop:1243 length:909 start_codon:yes stop_codon:yes gene_type:complete